MHRQNLENITGTGEAGGFIHEEIGECLFALGRPEEARSSFATAYRTLSQDIWLVANEPDRLERLKTLAGL